MYVYIDKYIKSQLHSWLCHLRHIYTYMCIYSYIYMCIHVYIFTDIYIHINIRPTYSDNQPHPHVSTYASYIAAYTCVITYSQKKPKQKWKKQKELHP